DDSTADDDDSTADDDDSTADDDDSTAGDDDSAADDDDSTADDDDSTADDDSTPPPPVLADLWSGAAHFVVDPAGPLGWSGFHFPTTWWDGAELKAWYIQNDVVDGIPRSITGHASSTDGVTFADQGTAIDRGGAWQWSWNTATDLLHAIGHNDSGGWAATTAADNAGYMAYGPYVSSLPAGPMTVSFELLVDNNSADNLPVVSLDVFDATAGAIVAQQDILRSEFAAPWQLQTFNLEYTQQASHVMEFRTFYYDVSFVRQAEVGVSQGQVPFSDDRLASFPGVWKDGDTWYLVYEAAGTDSSWPGDISLATSPDGLNWSKDSSNPILIHDTTGWESLNIGTPSLWKEQGTWLLLYHGWNGQDVQLGLASGPSLDSLTKHPANPVLETSTNGWDSGTVGARSIRKQGGWYYMAYEGSTDPPFDAANWSTGIARSQDLVLWEKYSGNPVLPITNASFGYDGPEFIETPDGVLHLTFRHPAAGNWTWRASLQWLP
ncbi:MAG: hypothetical protein CMP23_09380, partial [Rickettsiales bacterium]|nr:hypothetical protein [Rickettsiales bacterium]